MNWNGVGNTMRELWVRMMLARTQWTFTERRSGYWSDAEREAVDRAFKKFDEGFKEIDESFKGWRT